MRADQRADDRDDLDQADERADEQPVVEADDVEAGREHRSHCEHHQQPKPRVGAEAAVDREVGLTCRVALRLRRERGEQPDDGVALGDAVPGRGEREEDRDDRLARLVAVRRDRVHELCPRRELPEVLLEPGEHAVSNSCGLAGVRAGDRVVVERVRDLVERRRYREPDEEPDRSAEHDEVEEDPDRLGDVVPAEPLDTGPDRGCECDREQQEDEDAPHLPEAEGERDDRERGGRRLRDADGRVAVARRLGAFGWCLGGDHQTGARAGGVAI